MYKISDVSQLTGLSTHTLRYYEEIGLLPAVNKNCSGIREYSDEDVAFIEFVKDLKEMGLSLEEIIHFGKEGCVNENSALTMNNQLFSVLTKRLAVLENHLRELDEKRKIIENHRAKIIDRMSLYKAMINK
ncbi:DNA-binding transcriptional regulator, MerR family [Paenibacillus sophorae]|uniref:DNA-binding transcriptional regulator, MerR family n=1 Tax=Paenibacillus sophorae TaxID=1333845 RepID=A0A1H8J163_9BACL|nr:MerR family transcriptional regulator [Paenibacillus sophorae]QWU16153.1 MerR family transcriptional regulator [Paenibacillus sophorae]SEN74036.1 DNA-binding transcriptional regulator, MerR family [Paenibacillus sophorae]